MYCLTVVLIRVIVIETFTNEPPAVRMRLNCLLVFVDAYWLPPNEKTLYRTYTICIGHI